MTAGGPAPGPGGGAALRDMVTAPERRAAWRAAGLWDDTTLPARVAAHAAGDPSALAVVDAEGRREHSVGALWRDAAAFAGWLASRGIGAGDVVSVQLPNWYETVVADLGVLASGAVLNPLLPIYRRRELAHVCSVARPKAIVTPALYRGHDHLAETQALLAETGHDAAHVVVAGEGEPAPAVPGVATALAEILVGAGGGEDLPAPAGRESAAVSEIIFTSGTEATPKAIMHTEETANFSVRVAYDDLGMGPGDVVWMPSPIGHSTGFNYGVRFALYHGLALVLQDRWDAAVAADLVSSRRATYTLASTTFLQDLVVEAERRAITLPSLVRFGCGGAPVPPDLVRRASAREIGVLRLYGSTEVLVATWNRPTSPPSKRIGTDGPPLTGIEIEVRDEHGGPSAPGEPGELHTRGPDTCVGFFADPERTAATFLPGGWVRSGDLVTLDADGYVTVVGRKKEIIIRGGLNITPREIEDLILDFPEVDRVAVVGIPDERLGERVCACVVTAPGASLELADVIERLRAQGLATYKLPERLELVAALPMTASGKVQKFEIVRSLSQEVPAPPP